MNIGINNKNQKLALICEFFFHIKLFLGNSTFQDEVLLFVYSLYFSVNTEAVIIKIISNITIIIG